MDVTLILIWIWIFVFYFFIRKFFAKLKEFKEIGVPYIGPIEAATSFIKIMTMRIHFIDNIEAIYERFKNDKLITGFSFSSTRTFTLMDPEVIKQITVKDFDSFINHDKNFNTEVDNIMGRMLSVLVDEEWRNMRSVLSPIFTSSKMKMMFGVLQESANDFVDLHLEKTQKGEKVLVDVKEMYPRYTVDGISTAVLGFKGDCIKNKESELFKFVERMRQPKKLDVLKTLIFVASRWLFVKLKLQLTTKEVRDFFHRVIIKVMQERDEKGIFRPDVIQLLLQAKKGQLKIEHEEEEKHANFAANIEYEIKAKDKKVTHWTDEHFMAQGFIFFAAGFETTNVLLQMTSYYLAMNREYQQDLIDEVDEVISSLNGSPVTYEALHKMKFLDMVISEALRLWPPAALTNRECNRNYKMNLGNGKIFNAKVGDQFLIPISAIHHDANFFEDPLKFDPYRFSDERKDKIIPGSYIPFGYGPRVCIGSRFALMEVKLLIFSILSHFSIETCEDTPKKLELEPSFSQLKFKNSIIVEYKPRKKDV